MELLLFLQAFDTTEHGLLMKPFGGYGNGVMLLDYLLKDTIFGGIEIT